MEEDDSDNAPVNDTTTGTTEETVNTESTPEMTEAAPETVAGEQNDIPATGDVMGGNASMLMSVLFIAGMIAVISMLDKKRVR